MSTQTMSLSTASRFTIPALRERHDPWFQAMLALTVLTVVCAGLSLVDERTFGSVPTKRSHEPLTTISSALDVDQIAFGCGEECAR